MSKLTAKEICKLHGEELQQVFWGFICDNFPEIAILQAQMFIKNEKRWGINLKLTKKQKEKIMEIKL